MAIDSSFSPAVEDLQSSPLGLKKDRLKFGIKDPLLRQPDCKSGRAGMTWWQAFLGAGTGALLFGLAAIRTNGIAFPTGLHIAWNFGQWCLGFKKETGILQGIAEKGFEGFVERNAWMGYLMVMTIAIVMVYFYQPKQAELP